MLCLAVFCSLYATGSCFPGQNTPPVFDMKREWLIPEDELVGRRVTTVRTRDDEGDPIVYGMEPAVFLDGSSYFTIDKKTGKVFVARPLTGLAGNEYYLFITANDGHQTAKIEVYVRIVKVNDSPPPAIVDNSPHSPAGPPSNPSSYLPHLTFHTLSKPHRPPPFRPHLPDTFHYPEIYSNSSNSVSSTSTVRSTVEGDGGPNKKLDWISTIFPLVATVAFAPVVGVLFWLLLRRCKVQEKIKAEKKSSVRREESEVSNDGDINILYLQRPRIAHSNRYESGESNGVLTEHGKWEYPRHHLRFLGLLGEGCFGQVWKCCLHDKDKLVAVKTLKENASDKEKRDLVNELEVMKLLDPHPNVVTLLGCCTDRDPLFLILEYVGHGKLQTYLRESRAERLHGNLTSRDLTHFAYQVAKAMEYLSDKGIIHRDLAARNVLVGEGKTCKVADFGFARDLANNHVYERKSEGRLPIRWMAPESLYDNIYTTKTDVWSFGVLMWEIVTLGSTPYPGMSASEVMRRVREEDYRLEKPEHCRREVYNIMFYCWEGVSDKRPSFPQLLEMLDRLLVGDTDYIELDRFPDHSYYNITGLSGEKL